MTKLGATISYAQNREDLYLASFFPDVKQGFYVDVGANHPIHDSVTQYFYERGWNGINVEPNQKLYELLLKERPRDINKNLGISNKEGELVFREYENHGLSTFSGDIQASYSKLSNPETRKYVDRKVKTVTLKTLFSDQKVKHIHFLKVDVEGYELEVLKSNDWNKFQPEVICIESNHVDKVACQQLLDDFGYKKVFFDGLNDYFLNNKSERRLKLFEETYPDIIVKNPVLPYVWEAHFKGITHEVEHYKKLAFEREKELIKAQKTYSEAVIELGKLNSVKYAARHLAKLLKNKLTK